MTPFSMTLPAPTLVVAVSLRAGEGGREQNEVARVSTDEPHVQCARTRSRSESHVPLLSLLLLVQLRRLEATTVVLDDLFPTALHRLCRRQLGMGPAGEGGEVRSGSETMAEEDATGATQQRYTGTCSDLHPCRRLVDTPIVGREDVCGSRLRHAARSDALCGGATRQ